MTQYDYFARLCEMEASIHMAKAQRLRKNTEAELFHLKNIKQLINEIFEGCISETETHIYLAG